LYRLAVALPCLTVREPASQQPSAICCLLATMDNNDNTSKEKKVREKKERKRERKRIKLECRFYQS